MSIPEYKEIKLCNQPRLSLCRTIGIAIDGVRYRLFRAAVTVAVIAVAVAFMMNIVSESLVKRRLASDARRSLNEMRNVHRWVARLSRPAEPAVLLAAAAASDVSERFMAALGDKAAQDRFVSKARMATAYLSFFDDLNYDQYRTLIHSRRGVDIFDGLQAPAAFAAFESRLAGMVGVRFGMPLETFRAFLDTWPALYADLNKVAAAREAAIAHLNALRGQQTVLESLAQPDGSFIQAAREAGFRLDPETAERITRQAQEVLDRALVEGGLGFRESRQLLARHFDLLPSDVSVNELWHFLAVPEQARRYHEAVASLAPGLAAMDQERLVHLAASRQDEKRFERVERLTVGAGEGLLGLGERMGWLLIVSMLVCTIGITNAMLMTVTERFREIATMKCLGALDGFIMLLFVLESCLLGLAGGCVGSLLGILIGLGRMATRFGGNVFTTLPVANLAVATGLAIGVGMVLAAVAAVYPSIKAARLAPMEAMRLE